jgi:hypothetical protein
MMGLNRPLQAAALCRTGDRLLLIATTRSEFEQMTTVMLLQ